jgi:hypothetical protein
LVGDAIPFCPACGAPQIRVAPREPQVAGASPVDVPPPPPPLGRIDTPSALSYPGQIHWKTFFRLAVPLAAVVGFLMSIQSELGLFVVLPGAIAFVIYYYRRRQPVLLTAWTGAKLGMFVGFVSFVFFALFFAVESAANIAAYRQAMAQLIEYTLAHQFTPEAQQLAKAWLGGPYGVALITVSLLMSALFFLLLISGVTGALVGAFSRGSRNDSGSV